VSASVSEFPVLSQSLFDRAAHHRGDQAWLDEAWKRGRVLRISPQATTPVRREGEAQRLEFVAAADVADPVEYWFLGLADDVPYFAVTEAAGEGWLTLRDVGLTGDELELDLLVTAVALIQWHSRSMTASTSRAPTRQ
jgi:NAD+ diphosphatase